MVSDGEDQDTLDGAALIIRLESTGDFPIVEILGELDVASVGSFEETFDVLDAERICIVSFELATFVDSSAIGILTQRHRASKGAMILVIPANCAVSRIFDITGMRGVLHIVTDREKALDLARYMRDVPAASFSRDGMASVAAAESS